MALTVFMFEVTLYMYLVCRAISVDLGHRAGTDMAPLTKSKHTFLGSFTPHSNWLYCQPLMFLQCKAADPQNNKIIEWPGLEGALNIIQFHLLWPWAGPPSTRSGYSKPHPACPIQLSGWRHPQLLWASSLISLKVRNFFPVFNLNWPSFSLKPLPPLTCCQKIWPQNRRCAAWYCSASAFRVYFLQQ